MTTQEKIIYLQKRFGLDESTAQDKVMIMEKYSAQMANSDIDLIALAKKIRPLVRINKNGQVCYFGGPEENPESELYWSKPVDIVEASFNYEPEPMALESFGLTKLLEITTYHQSSCHAFPNPTTAEVLLQMPEDFADKAAGFEIYIPYDRIADSYDEVLQLNRFRTIFYSGKLPAKIVQQGIVARGQHYY